MSPVGTALAGQREARARFTPGAPGAPVIALRNVTKHYRSGGGIDDVTLEVHPGEVFGFLGPNGAGKTTTIRLLVDLIRPDRGELSIFGLDPRRDGIAVRRRIGYLPGDLVLYEKMTAGELLLHFARLRGGPGSPEIEALAEQFALDLRTPIAALSKGNKQKVGFLQAVMGTPELLVLDEPTTGLDPLVQHQAHELLRAVAGSGRTVFLSSHFLSEVQQVADRVAMIKAGRVVAVESVAGLRSRSVHLVDVRTVERLEPEAFSRLPGVGALQATDFSAHFEFAGPLDPLVRELSRLALADLSIREPDLEDVFLSYYDGHDDTAAPSPALGRAGSDGER